MTNQGEFMSDNNKDKASLRKKMQRTDPVFCDSVDGLPATDVKANILIYAKHQHDSELALSLDEEIQSTQEQLKELKAPYSEVIKSLKAKIKYLHLILEDKVLDENA